VNLLARLKAKLFFKPAPPTWEVTIQFRDTLIRFGKPTVGYLTIEKCKETNEHRARFLTASGAWNLDFEWAKIYLKDKAYDHVLLKSP
jgi:hypothetical protein